MKKFAIYNDHGKRLATVEATTIWDALNIAGIQLYGKVPTTTEKFREWMNYKFENAFQNIKAIRIA